jgi:ankyrin repeat protein
MSEEIEVSDIFRSILDFCNEGNSVSHEPVSFIKKNFGDLLLNELRNCRSVKLNSKNLDVCSLKEVLEAVISWGNFNAVPAPLKALIICLWSYLKRRIYRKRKSLLTSWFSANDVYDLELFYSFVMKNSLSVTWTRAIQEIFRDSVQHPGKFWISTSHKLQHLLEVLTQITGNEEQLSMFTGAVSPDVINVTYPLLNGITLLHYISFVSDNLMQNIDLIRILTASSSSIDLNCVDYSGQTPLHYACLSLNYAFIMNLCSLRGINKSVKDCKGRTPLQTFLEIVAKSARSRFLISVERTSTIIKELLPNNDPLFLWELWSTPSVSASSCSSSYSSVLNRRTAYQSSPIHYVLSFCNVAVAYEMLNLSIPLISCTSTIILILTELFIITIKRKKNSLLSKLFSFLSSNCDSYWKKNEFRWSLNNLLMTVSTISGNLDSLSFCYENLLLSCEMNSLTLLDIQQSVLKRSEYLGFLYILIMKEPNDWVISGKTSLSSIELRNDSYAVMNNVVDSIIKQLSVLLGQHLYLLISPVFNLSNDNLKDQFEQMLSYPSSSPDINIPDVDKTHNLSVNLLFPVFYSVILTCSAFEYDSISISPNNRNLSIWNKFVTLVEKMNFVTLSSFVGNSVTLDSLIKRLFFISKQSSSPAVDDDFGVKMKNEYCQSILSAIYFHKVNTIESLRNTVGFSEMGRMVFSSGIV